LNRSDQHSDNKGNSHHYSLRKERQSDVGGNIIHITPSSDESTGNLLETLSHKLTSLRPGRIGSIQV